MPIGGGWRSQRAARAQSGVRCLALALPLISLSCGALPQFSREDVHCRSVVTAEGERAERAVRWVYIDDPDDRRFQNAWCLGVGPAVVYFPPAPRLRAATPAGDGPGGGLVDSVAAASTGAALPADPGDTLRAREPDLLGLTPEQAAERRAAARAQPLPPPPPVLDSLLVVSWNQHIGVGELDRLVSDIRSGELTGAPTEHFVLLLQEVFRASELVPAWEELPDEIPGGSRLADAPGPEADIVHSAQRLGLHLFYAPSMRNGIDPEPPEDRGNAILSTLPLRELRAMELPAGIQRRVAVQATVGAVDSAGLPWRLDVVSTHLDNASLGRPFASFGSVRGAQAEGLTRMLENEEGAIVVGGDFNTWFLQEEERAYRRMRHHFPLPRTPQPLPTATRLGVGRILDYLFFRGPRGWEIQDGRAGTDYGSDHYPVYGWVLVGPGRISEPRGEPADPDMPEPVETTDPEAPQQ